MEKIFKPIKILKCLAAAIVALLYDFACQIWQYAKTLSETYNFMRFTENNSELNNDKNWNAVIVVNFTIFHKRMI